MFLKLRGEVPRESRMAAASCLAGALLVPVRVRKVRAKDDQPGFPFIGHVAAGNAGVDLGEVGPRAGLLREAA